jgi:hypothetical protein
LVLKTATGVQILPRAGASIQLSNLPGGMLTKPTLVLKISPQGSGDASIRTSYQTAGMTWRADYNLILDANDQSADLGAWVSLLNLSGKSFESANLKLIAGDVQRVQSTPQFEGRIRALASKEADAAPGFEQRAFFEYHIYSLPRPTDIPNNSTQQIALFPTAQGIGVEKVLVYYGAQDLFGWHYGDSPFTDRNLGNSSNKKVDIYLKFKNSAENKLGLPLPAGKIRVLKADDKDDSLEFIGEDLIDHTAKDETLLIKLGSSFDVVGERTQSDFSIDLAAKRITESYKIILRNHKDTEQKVIVKENLFRWSNWEITQKSDEFEKQDSRTVLFPVTVKPNGEKVISYTVKYSW